MTAAHEITVSYKPRHVASSELWFKDTAELGAVCKGESIPGTQYMYAERGLWIVVIDF